METNQTLTGRCLCGAIRYRLTPPTDFLSHCHCRSCRLSHAAAFVTWTSVPEERFELLQGEEALRWYQSSEWIRWGFCGTCGSSLLYRATGRGHPEGPSPERVYIAAGSLEDPPDRMPEAHVSYEERLSWVELEDGLPRYRGKGEEEV